MSKHKYKIKSKRVLPDGSVVNVLKLGRDMFMTPDQAEIFIKAAYKYNLHWGFFFELMYQGFYRPMELISLEIGNFHFRTDTVYVFPMKRKYCKPEYYKVCPHELKCKRVPYNAPLEGTRITHDFMVRFKKYLDNYREVWKLGKHDRIWRGSQPGYKYDGHVQDHFDKIIALAGLNPLWTSNALRHAMGILVTRKFTKEAKKNPKIVIYKEIMKRLRMKDHFMPFVYINFVEKLRRESAGEDMNLGGYEYDKP